MNNQEQFKEQLKQAIETEFMYRAKQGRVKYSMEEVIYITQKVIDDEYTIQNSKDIQ